MFQMKVISVVDSLVNTLLVRQPDMNPGKAVLFELDLKLSSYEDNETFTSRTNLHLLYNKMHSYGRYISVFSYEGVVSTLIDPRDRGYIWKHEGTHDSCWRDLSLVSDIYFRCARVVNEQRQAAGYKPIPPRDMCDNAGPALFAPTFRFVDVEQVLLPRGRQIRNEYSIKIL